MKFTINATTTYLAILVIAFKITHIGLLYFLPDFSFDTIFYLILSFLSMLGAAYLYFYLRNFANQIMNYDKLDLPLLSLGWMMILFFVKEMLFQIPFLSDYSRSYIYLSFLGLIIIILDLLLFIRILRIPPGFYQRYFRYYGLLLILQLIITLSLPFISGIILDMYLIEFEDYNYYLDFCLDICKVSPIVILLFMILAHRRINPDKQISKI